MVLTVSAAGARADRGVLVAVAFGVGRGLPFLAAGLSGGLVTRFAGLARWHRALQLASGGALLAVAAYYGWAFTTL